MKLSYRYAFRLAREDQDRFDAVLHVFKRECARKGWPERDVTQGAFVRALVRCALKDVGCYGIAHLELPQREEVVACWNT